MNEDFKNYLAEQAENLKNRLTELLKTDSPALEKKGKDYNFSDVFFFIKKISDSLKTLHDNPDFWEEIPDTRQEAIKGIIYEQISHLEENVKRIQNFNGKRQDGDPQGEHKDIKNSIKYVHDKLSSNLFTKLKLFVLEKKISRRELDEFSKQAEKALDEVREIKKQAEKDSKVARQASKVARQASGETGVSNFAKVFADQAKENKEAADIWLKASVVAAGIIVIVIGFLLWWSCYGSICGIEAGDTSQVLQITLTKILLVSFCSAVFYQIVKNYNAKMHVYTLNKHRANSLQSFQAFVNSTVDPQTRDIVLIQITRYIFQAGQTGYVSSKDGSGAGMETIKISEPLKKDTSE